MEEKLEILEEALREVLSDPKIYDLVKFEDFDALIIALGVTQILREENRR